MGNKVSNLSTTLLFLQGGFKKQDKLKHQHLQVSFVLLVHRCSGIAPSPAAVTGPAVHTSDEQDETETHPRTSRAASTVRRRQESFPPSPRLLGTSLTLRTPFTCT